MSQLHKLHRWTQSDGEWACAAYDHGPFCRMCQPVAPDDSILRGMLDSVQGGHMEVRTLPTGELEFKMTETGTARAREIVARMGYDPDDRDSLEDAAREMARKPETN